MIRPSLSSGLPWAAVVLAALSATPAAPAADATNGPAPRVFVAKNASPSGALLSRDGNGTDWRPVAKSVMVSSRDVLLVLPGMRAVVETEPAGAALTLHGNMPQLTPSPVLESEVILHDSRAYDLDFTLLEGRVTILNSKEKGPARVWVRLPGFSWQLTLQEPGARVGLEVYGRWPYGVGFSKESHAGPTKAVDLLMLDGSAELQTDTHTYQLSAPPGPSLMEWDSAAGEAAGPRNLKKLPPWTDPTVQVPAEGKAIDEVANIYLAGLKKSGSPEEALAGLLDQAAQEKDKPRAALLRQFAVLGLNAAGALPRVAEALADAHSADVRDAAVLALRMWIGGAPGRDLELYHLLQGRLGYSDHQAEAVLDLLHSPFDPDRPGTYEALIRLLQHPKLAVRELARWHLYRLAPAGKEIPFDPAAPEEERDRAVKAWKELIPDGELPKEKKAAPGDGRKR